LAEFADALIAFLGTHEAAAVDLIASFTSRAPQRIRSLICDGIPFLGPRARRQLLKQDCPPIAVARDGSHLLAIWHQLRDRELHWPWYERAVTAIRRVTPDFDARRMHAMSLDVARQLNHYGDLSRATWGFDLAPLLAQVSQPVLLFKDQGDPRLAASLKVKRRLPAAQLIERPKSSETLFAAVSKFWRSLDERRST
jgi:pimeloyl-ACP methyl ester carboxylesterase